MPRHELIASIIISNIISTACTLGIFCTVYSYSELFRGGKFHESIAICENFTLEISVANVLKYCSLLMNESKG